VVSDEDTIAALASNAASSAFRGLSGQPPSSQYFPAENQLSQALATIVETSSEDVLDYEEACEDAPSNSRLPDALDDTESVRVPNSESSEPGSANLGLSSSHMDCSTIIDSSKKGCEISAMRIPSPNETLEGLPKDSQSPSLLQISAILAEREAPLVEAIVGGYLNANGAMEYRIRPLPDSPDEQQSPASEFEAFTQNPSVNSDVGIPALSTSDDSLQRSSGPSSSLAAAEKAVLEAMSLFKSDSFLETLSRRVEEEQIFLPEACKDLCDALNVLANEYTNRNLLHQALIAVLIMEVNFKGFLKFPVAISTICLYNKARIFRKTGIFRLSEEAYRQAIDSCRSLGEARLRLRCQLHLGNLLRTLNRDTEALHLLIQTMVEQFRSENLSANKKRLARLIFSIKEMHSKMDEAGKMDEVVMIVRELFRLAMNPEPHPGCSIPIITAWSSIIQLGIAYSKLELFAIADLCFFGFGEPSVPHNFLYWMERARSRRGLCEHYQRQNKLSKGLEQLKMSFEAILPLAGTARYPKSFVDGLRLLLDQLKPNTGHMTTWTEFGLMRDWEAAERSCDQLVRLFVQSGGTDVREVRIELGGVPF
jgi:tetratricopeptide (TPR) repeat protein